MNADVPFAGGSSPPQGAITKAIIGILDPNTFRRCLVNSENKPLPVPPPNPYTKTTVGVIMEERACSLNEFIKPLIMPNW